MKDCTVWWRNHKWGKWEVTDKSGALIQVFDQDQKPVGHSLIQHRKCAVCDYTQIDMQRVTVRDQTHEAGRD